MIVIVSVKPGMEYRLAHQGRRRNWYSTRAQPDIRLRAVSGNNSGLPTAQLWNYPPGFSSHSYHLGRDSWFEEGILHNGIHLCIAWPCVSSP